MQEESESKPTIITEKRTHDWIAYLAQNPGMWEAGATEGEAIRKLHVSHPDVLGVIQRRES